MCNEFSVIKKFKNSLHKSSYNSIFTNCYYRLLLLLFYIKLKIVETSQNIPFDIASITGLIIYEDNPVSQIIKNII